MPAEFVWLISIVGIFALGVGAVWGGYVPPPHARTVLRLQSGFLRVKRGTLRSYAREHVVEILSEAKVKKGFIAMTASDQVFFSRNIPAAVRRRLRNVLLNQSS